mmetsp:Transcript_30610/g.66026  ORF Transcript_30610/g.66026 Transcript_30610/m.66026 type:complete len:329 (-) Transcript_30610:554-1540(-)
MGTGASSSGGGGSAEAAVPGAPGASATAPQRSQAQGSAAISSSASTAVVDVVEGGVQWLASVVDREKHEKDWLAKQYEAKCQEVRALQQELASMKHELAETRRLAGLGVAPSHSVAGSGNKAAHALHSSGSSGSNSNNAPADGNPTSPGGNLMGRRGLALHIECEGKRRATIGSTHVEVVSPVKDTKTPSNASQADHTSPSSAVASGTDAEKPKADPWKNEPVSALLKRRSVRNAEFDPLPPNSDRPGCKEKEEAEKESPVSHVTSQHEAPPPASMERRNSEFEQGLRVQAGKVQVLEDFPASPKRVSLRRSQTAGGAADFAGSGGTF